jgi:hypothetical protein
MSRLAGGDASVDTSCQGTWDLPRTLRRRESTNPSDPPVVATPDSFSVAMHLCRYGAEGIDPTTER